MFFCAYVMIPWTMDYMWCRSLPSAPDGAGKGGGALPDAQTIATPHNKKGLSSKVASWANARTKLSLGNAGARSATRLTILSTHRLQYPLIREYTLNYSIVGSLV